MQVSFKSTMRWLALSAIAGHALAACENQCDDGLTECYQVKSGRYLAYAPKAPATDDGMHLLVYFHGWSGSAEKYSKKTWLRDGASDNGYLLVLPDGVDQTWAHVGSPSTARDELAFMDEVLDDVSTRWEITSTKAVAGFSQGGSMAWDLACYRPHDYSAFIPASGSFWEPLPAECSGAVHLRHTHGTADTVIPLEGRPIGTSKQGNVSQGFDILRASNECPEAPDRSETKGELSCEIWESCQSGRELRLCLHDGKHSLPSGYLPDALEWVESVSPSAHGD